MQIFEINKCRPRRKQLMQCQAENNSQSGFEKIKSDADLKQKKLI